MSVSIDVWVFRVDVCVYVRVCACVVCACRFCVFVCVGSKYVCVCGLCIWCVCVCGLCIRCVCVCLCLC